MTKKQAEKNNAIEKLKEGISKGDTVYTSLQSSSRNGMSRRVYVYIALVDSNGKPYIKNISYFVAAACGFRYNDKWNAVTVGGCGMDSGFHIVSTLASVLGVYTNYQEEDKDGKRGNCYGLNHYWI